MAKNSLAQVFSNKLDLNIGILDHYTLIVDNADSSAKFYCNVLGFKYISEKRLNTGTAPDGEFDMLNHILTLPKQPNVACVITEGLTKESFFSPIFISAWSRDTSRGLSS